MYEVVICSKDGAESHINICSVEGKIFAEKFIRNFSSICFNTRSRFSVNVNQRARDRHMVYRMSANDYKKGNTAFK